MGSPQRITLPPIKVLVFLVKQCSDTDFHDVNTREGDVVKIVVIGRLATFSARKRPQA